MTDKNSPMVPVMIRIPAHWDSELRFRAADSGRTRSQLIRDAILAHLGEDALRRDVGEDY